MVQVSDAEDAQLSRRQGSAARLRSAGGHLRDVLAGSDPGLARLRMAAAGAGSMGGALGVEYLIATARGADPTSTLIAMLLGAVISMMGSMALTGREIWPMVRTAMFFPVAMGIGMVPGTLLAEHTDAMLVVFVAMMFVAVFVRRFGLPFFFYGFMLWIGYFFASFLHTQVSMLPGLILDVAIGAAWVLLLSATVLRTSPRRTLQHVRRSVGARARSLAADGVELLRCDASDERAVHRARRKLRGRQVALGEAALMVEAWSADPSALPEGWSAQALRRRLLDLQIALDALTGATDALVDGDRGLKRIAARILAALADRDYVTAGRAARLLQKMAERARDEDMPGWWPALHLSAATEQLLDVVRTVGSPPEIGDDSVFTPAVSLALGNLPGSPAIARNVPVRGARWNPLTRLDFTTRQAVQVAVAGGLAILFGRELNQTRYYWAVIAAFIAFTGTGTRSETFIKASNRVLGTLTGLVAGIACAHLTAGHTGWILAVIVASMFLGFYLIRLSYAYMIFFVTIMVSQLYSVLGEFSNQLLVLRLEETVIGAACGIAVALLVAPLSTRDTVASSQTSLFETLADVLNSVADRVGDIDTGSAAPDLDGAQRVLDNRLRELLQVSAPLTRPLLHGNSPRRARHDLALYSLLVAASRSVAAALRSPHTPPAQLATAARALAATARKLAEQPPQPGRTEHAIGGALDEPLARADAALFTATEEDDERSAGWAAPAATARRALIRLHGVLREIAVGDPQEPTPARPSAQPAAAATR